MITIPKESKIVTRELINQLLSKQGLTRRELLTINIPAGVEEISTSAFEQCTALKQVTIEFGVKRISTYAFGDCKSLEQITIPGSVDIIERAFSGCSKLSKVVLEHGVAMINSAAFDGCISLMHVLIPSSFQHCGPNVFNDCTQLETIVVPASLRLQKNQPYLKYLTSGTKARIIHADTLKQTVENEIAIRNATLRLEEKICITGLENICIEGLFEIWTCMTDANFIPNLQSQCLDKLGFYDSMAINKLSDRSILPAIVLPEQCVTRLSHDMATRDTLRWGVGGPWLSWLTSSQNNQKNWFIRSINWDVLGDLRLSAKHGFKDGILSWIFGKKEKHCIALDLLAPFLSSKEIQRTVVALVANPHERKVLVKTTEKTQEIPQSG